MRTEAILESPDYAVLDAAIEQAKKTLLAPMVDTGRLMKVDCKLAAKLAPPAKPAFAAVGGRCDDEPLRLKRRR